MIQYSSFSPVKWSRRLLGVCGEDVLRESHCLSVGMETAAFQARVVDRDLRKQANSEGVQMRRSGVGPAGWRSRITVVTMAKKASRLSRYIEQNMIDVSGPVPEGVALSAKDVAVNIVTTRPAPGNANARGASILACWPSRHKQDDGNRSSSHGSKDLKPGIAHISRLCLCTPILGLRILMLPCRNDQAHRDKSG